MFTPKSSIRKRALVWFAAVLAAITLVSAHGNAAAQSQPAYSQPELDRMLAPIALYPDPLLSQIFMAATYPIEVVEAARWSRAHPALQGDAAVRAVEDEDWDPSVKSLVAFPNVLARMDEDLEWTRQLGDAFLDQEAQVMETVQALRRRAHAAGSLASDARVRVIDDGRTLAVEPVDPTIIYVPYYDPRVAYGAWWWPAYPPVVWAPWPGYAVRHPHPGVAVGFFWGPAVRISVGFFFGAIDWPHREVRVVSVTNYYYRPVIVRRTVEVHKHVVVAPGRWHHDPHHRRGVTYRTPDMQRRFAPLAPLEARRAEPRRPETVAPRPERRAVRADSAPPDTRDAPRRDPQPEARRNAPPHDGRTALRQPGHDTPRTTPPAPASRTESSARDPSRNPSRTRERDAEAHMPKANEPAQGNTRSERAQRGASERPESKAEPPRGPRKGDRTDQKPPAGDRGQS